MLVHEVLLTITLRLSLVIVVVVSDSVTEKITELVGNVLTFKVSLSVYVLCSTVAGIKLVTL